MNKKKVIVISIVILFLILLGVFFYKFIINNDDFAPYINKEYDETYDITSDIYDSSIKYVLTPIAQKYEEGVELTYAQYDIEGNNKTAEFQFYKDDYNGKNKVCIVTILVSIDEKKVTKIKYEKGNGKRVSGYSTEIATFEKVSNYINPNENIKITITSEGITLYKDGQKIETTDFIKNVTNNLEPSKFEGYKGIVTEINSNNITFEDKSTNKKYLIDCSNNYKYINGRTNEEINENDIKVGYYISTYTYGESEVISILSDIKGEELKKELIKNLSLENPIYKGATVSGENLNIINNNKAILTLKVYDLVEDYNSDSNFEMQVELNQDTTIQTKVGYNKIEQLGDVTIDVISIRLDKNTINSEIPKATFFSSSCGN